MIVDLRVHKVRLRKIALIAYFVAQYCAYTLARAGCLSIRMVSALLIYMITLTTCTASTIKNNGPVRDNERYVKGPKKGWA